VRRAAIARRAGHHLRMRVALTLLACLAALAAVVVVIAWRWDRASGEAALAAGVVIAGLGLGAPLLRRFADGGGRGRRLRA
jgi:hypothetical protein